jgi:1-phosphatidylinositol-4-phosphate 5-kinase
MIKRVEHFFKGLSNVESQISPIPPERYGDRFVRFISGITKSMELALQEKADKVMSPIGLDQPAGEGHTSNSYDGAERGEMVRSPTDKVMAKAEKQAEKSRDDLNKSEGIAPDRSISTVRSPSVERQNDGGFTLPVLEEVGESSSTGHGSRSSERSRQSPTSSPKRRSRSQSRGRDRAGSPASSIRSHQRYRHSQMDGTREEMTDLERDKMLPSTPPRTPPKDSKENSLNDRPRSRLENVDVDKALPLPPPGQVTV